MLCSRWAAQLLVPELAKHCCPLAHLAHPCSRIVMVGARDRLLPPQLSRISKRTQTPVFAQLLVGGIICEALGIGRKGFEGARGVVWQANICSRWLVPAALQAGRHVNHSWPTPPCLLPCPPLACSHHLAGHLYSLAPALCCDLLCRHLFCDCQCTDGAAVPARRDPHALQQVSANGL